MARFGLNTAFFRFFTHEEIFSRIAERDTNNQLRIAIERRTDSNRLLAATGLNKPVMLYDDLQEILEKFKADEGGIRYHNGTVVSTHTPRIGQSQFKIAGDQFTNKFELHCPIDGYGQPAVYLALLRWICSNGAVGFANAFKTSLVLGSGTDNASFAIQRALDSFTNDEGYAIMRSKFDLAAHSWASIRERESLYRLLLGMQHDPILADHMQSWDKINPDDALTGVFNALMKAFDRCAGDPFQMYRSDPKMMSDKRQRTLPVACKVYDLLNFATEMASHHVTEANARQLQAWVGGMLSSDFDLEGSADEFTDWRSLFVPEKPKTNHAHN